MTVLKIAPLIYSRTLHCDFHTNFAVRPKDIDVTWARNKVLLAMNNINNLNGIRKIVAAKGDICIAGIGCNLSDFIEKNLPEVKESAEKYFQDDNGRYIKVFLGYAFKGSSIPNVSHLDLWKMFEKYFTPEWERKFFETVIAHYDYEVSEKNSVKDIPNGEKVSNINFYIDETTSDKLVDYCLTERKNLCTNVDQMKIIDSGEFEIILTSRGLIDRFKSEQEKKTSVIQSTQKAQESTQRFTQKNNPPLQTQTSNNQKISLKTLSIGVAILIILAVVFLFMK